MIIMVDSLTGNGINFAKHLEGDIRLVGKDKIKENEKFFLLTRSFGFGQVPESTVSLLEQFAYNCIGVAVSGNKNWGANFGKAGEIIQEKYDIPLVLKFEGSGFKSDWEKISQYIKDKEHGYE